MAGAEMTKKKKGVLKQRSTNDCGIACMAMLLDETYANVKEVVQDYFARVLRKKFCGMDENDDKAVAAAFGERVKKWSFNKKNRKAMITKLLDRRAILCVPGWGHDVLNGGEWHAVYWDGRELHDPNPTKGQRYPKNGVKAFAAAKFAIVLHAECKNCSVEVVG